MLRNISKKRGKVGSYKRIGLDTNVLIYYIEEHPIFMKKIKPLIDKIARGEATGITSYVIELLVEPLREGRLDLVDPYRTILMEQLEIVPLDETVSVTAAELRAK